MGLLDDWWGWRQGNASSLRDATRAGTDATMTALRGGLLDDAGREALVNTPAAWLGTDPMGKAGRAANLLDMSPEARAARAAEQGYTVDAYHGTRSDFDQFAGRNRYGQGQPQYFTLADEPGGAPYASSYAEGDGGRVMPVKLNMDKVLDARKPDDLAALRSVIDNDWQLGRDGSDAFIQRKFKDGLPGWGDDNLFRALDEAGYLGVVLRERPELTSVAMWEPSNIRSRFAAFDPARANDPDLLASYSPGALNGLLATDDDKRNRKP